MVRVEYLFDVKDGKYPRRPSHDSKGHPSLDRHEPSGAMLELGATSDGRPPTSLASVRSMSLLGRRLWTRSKSERASAQCSDSIVRPTISRRLLSQPTSTWPRPPADVAPAPVEALVDTTSGGPVDVDVDVTMSTSAGMMSASSSA